MQTTEKWVQATLISLQKAIATLPSSIEREEIVEDLNLLAIKLEDLLAVEDLEEGD